MIAVDVMGGDRAPGAVISGAVKAARMVPVLLVGPEQKLRSLLDQVDPAWRSYNIHFCNAEEVIEMGEDPVAAVRKKNDASLVKAVACVKQGTAVAALSAGNSGALMTAATFILGKADDLERPAIAGFFPSISDKKALVLDLGANTDCRAQHLYQFAVIGADYLKKMHGLEKPLVGLLSNGGEDSKGSRTTKEAFYLFKQSTLNFVGNVEPSDIFNPHVDVIICDGFAGNILLKTMESSFEVFLHFLKKHCGVYKNSTDFPFAQSFAQSFMTNLATSLDYKKYGGALLLGVKGNVIVCHGNSDAKTIENAILFAWDSFK